MNRAASSERSHVRGRPVAWAFIPSLALHGVIVAGLAWAMVGRPLEPEPIRSVEVELVNPAELEDAFEVPPAANVAPLAVPAPTAELVSALSDGMTDATQLFANRVLSDPQNRQVRETLPKLENTERITQLCNIEGLEQLRLARPEPLPDSIAAGAFTPALLNGLTLDGPAAAFRAARRWYRLRFSCTAAPGLGSVAAYRFAIGEPIPEEEWEAHDLIAEDEDE